MNNHEEIDFAIDGIPEFTPEEDIKIEGVKEWHVEKEENHNGI